MKKTLRYLLPVLVLGMTMLRSLAPDTIWGTIARGFIWVFLAGELILSFVQEYSPDSGPTRQGRARLIAKRVDSWRSNYGNGFFYVATFRLGNYETELLTTEGEYRSLTVDTEGLLFWQGDEMVSFRPE